MNLVIDIGNTVAKIAVFDESGIVEVVHDSNSALRHLGEVLRVYPVQRGILSTVIPLSEDAEDSLKQSGVPFLRFTSLTPVPISNLYKTPQTLGSDRLAAVVAAHALMPERDVLVVDAGTCITYDFVSSSGCYRGGNISPGVAMRLKAMHTFTGKLPMVTVEGETPFWGESTETAMRAGVIQGVRMETEGYIRFLEKEYPSLSVILTGGDAEFLTVKGCREVLIDKELVLKGLNRILNYNDKK